MATSSIFARIRIDNPEKVDAFIEALEISENASKRKSAVQIKPPLTDYDAIRKLMAKGNTVK